MYIYAGLLVCLRVVQHSTEYQRRNNCDYLCDKSEVSNLLIVTLYYIQDDFFSKIRNIQGV